MREYVPLHINTASFPVAVACVRTVLGSECARGQGDITNPPGQLPRPHASPGHASLHLELIH